MIFVTVGSQLPFDRLVKAIDAWAAKNGRQDVFAQIGHNAWRPKYIKWVETLKPEEFQEKVKTADLIISHAGVGTILSSLELGKRILVMPRMKKLDAIRGEHQIHMTKSFSECGLLNAAFDEKELLSKLEDFNKIPIHEKIGPYASAELIDAISDFIDSSPAACPKARSFDGIICFGGEDWWYHNRGHYDMQMMRKLSQQFPVLYVNSLGMRIPKLKEGATFFLRLNKKIRSLMRGLRIPFKNFGVLSLWNIPGLQNNPLLKMLMSHQAKRAAKKLGIRSPLVWINCPPAVELLDSIPHEYLVYQRTDRYEKFPDIDIENIKSYDLKLKREADITLFCSSLLFEEESADCKRALFVDHGVDYQIFNDAADRHREPQELKKIPHPRIGFIGGIEAFLFDSKLFLEVAGSLKDYSFILVGDSALPKNWCNLSNVYQLGQRPYEEVADYMAASDVLIMPWNKNDWIKACNPVKLKEYLAVGKPVVSTWFYELKRYGGFVSIAENAHDFIMAIKKALASPQDPDFLRERVKDETWEKKAEMVIKELEKLEIITNPRPGSQKG